MDELIKNKKEIFYEIFGCDLTDASAKKQIMENFTEIDQKFVELGFVYGDEPNFRSIILSCRNDVNELYNKISLFIIEQTSEEVFDMPIEMAISTKQQENIILVFKNKLNYISEELQNKIISDIKEIANEINKRFTFDDETLINLIEASCGKNIQTEEGMSRTSTQNKRVFLRNDVKKGYVFSTSSSINNYTHNNKPITDRLESNEILSRNYPSGIEVSKQYQSKEEIMKKIISNLLDNLELCYETYKKYYMDERTIVPVENEVKLADDSHFNFVYKYFAKNIPHLLGIQSAKKIPHEVRYILGNGLKELDENANAEIVLKAILDHKSDIISNGGLIEKNGKIYEMFPWEKIVLKTTSFMRGDFFKTCFCVKKLSDGKYLMNPNDQIKYVSISSTRYNEAMTDSKLNINNVLNDLLQTKRQSKDFIFKGFMKDYDSGLYVPKTVLTAKGENIRVGSSNELLKSLQRYRDILSGGEPAQVVQSIANENYIKTFSPEEQALLHIDISTNLDIKSKVSQKGFDFEIRLTSELDNILNHELENLSKGTLQRKK